ncbi:unnamed protein product [Microthlaspi erraticum]|uniref:F-box associated beta-propeller type 1 domain-containing protein n=1 Tax=Microthlaspi erraticum TaxID=1685480 RepID=A0A6D2K0S4_9BRAS|nr:unnamed protein product [Microthlaspi erraticum]
MEFINVLLSFDFTAERFGPRLPLPFHKSSVNCLEPVTISCVREEQLVLLYERFDGMMEFWITTKIDPNSVSWSMFLKVHKRSLPSFLPYVDAGTFFIDEAHKKVVVFSKSPECETTSCWYPTAYIIGEDGYFKSMGIREAGIRKKCGYYVPFVFSSYVPSLVQLEEKKEISN